jgi:hypothetical protein
MNNTENIQVVIKTMETGTKDDCIEKGDRLQIVFESGEKFKGSIVFSSPKKIYKSSSGQINIKIPKKINIYDKMKLDLYGYNHNHVYGIIAKGKLIIENMTKTPEKSKNTTKSRNIFKGILIAVGIATAIVTVFAIGVILYKFGARLPIDKISGILRNSNATLHKFGGGNFGVTNHVYHMTLSHMPVNGHGGTYKGRIWQVDMDYVPKSANDPIKPITQRELIKLDLDLIKGDAGNMIPRRNRKRIVRVYEKLLKKDKVGIPFKLDISGESEPDFSKVCYEMIKIKGSSGRYNKGGKKGNMTLASEKCSKKWRLPQKNFDKWRNDLQLVWHEAKKGKIYLVPHNIHQNVQHEGLIAQQKRLNN